MIHYYIENNGKVIGPLSITELKGKHIIATTLVWRHGLQNWTQAQEMEELKNVYVPGPPPLPSTIEKLYNADTPPLLAKVPDFKKPEAGIPKYDEKYRKEIEATIMGIFLFIIPILFIIFYEHAYKQNENYYYFKAISYAVAIGIRVFSVIWIIRIAKQQNRDYNKWGACALFFPAISLIVIGLRKKRYDSAEWKKYLYSEGKSKRIV